MKLNKNVKTYFLDKNKTQALHGLAILMMIYHHLFVYSNNWCITKGTSIFDIFNGINFLGKADTFQITVACFCKICVAVFAFTSGYAMYIQLDRRSDDHIDLKKLYKYCFARLFSFYKKFLLCFLFVTICDILMGKQYGFDYSLPNYLLNMLGLKSDYNATWWYVVIYYCMVLISPIVYSLLNEKFDKRKVLLVCVIFLSAVIIYFTYGLIINDFAHYIKMASKIVQSALYVYTLIFIEGMLCVHYGIFEKLSERINLFGFVIILFITFLLRVVLIRIPSDPIFDVLLIMPFVFSVSVILDKLSLLTSVYRYFGKYSTYMWYLHAYFYAYLFYDLVKQSDYSVVVYLQVVFYSLTAAIAFTYFEKGINSVINLKKAK